MKGLRRWLPLVGTAWLAVSVGLRVLGYEELAGPLQAVGEATGITDTSAVPADVFAAAIAAISGVALKIKSQVNKALRSIC